jgi:hypothetical protein
MIRRMTKTPAPRGPGRPPHGAVSKTVFFQIRCTEAQRDAIKELGGASWVLGKLAEETEQRPKRKTPAKG